MARHDNYVHRRTFVRSVRTEIHDIGTCLRPRCTGGHDDRDVRLRFRCTRLCDKIRGTAHADVVVVYGARVLEKNVQALEEHRQHTQSDGCAAALDPTAC